MSFTEFRLVAVATGMAACLLAAPANAEPVKIDFWFGNTGAIAKVVETLCDNFNQSQTDYQVTCTSQGGYDNALQNTIAAFRANKQPTIVQVYDVGTATMMLSGAVYPADKLMADNGYDVDWKDYFSGIARYYATSAGEMMSFPFNSSTAVLYWNKDALGKIGKDHAPATWEEAVEDMKALKASGMDCPMATDISPDESWQLLEQFSAIHGEPIATENNGRDGLDAELVFNKTRFVKFVSDLKSWYDAGLVQLKSEKAGEDYVQAFASGECAMTMSSIGDDGTIAKTQKDGMNWGVAMLPVYAGTDRKNSLVGGASLWVLKGKSPEEYKAAAAFLDFVRKPETALFWSTNTGYIPVLNSGYTYMMQHGFYDNEPYKDRAVAIESLTASEPTPVTRGIRLGNFTAIRGIVSDSLHAVFSDQEPVQQALDEGVSRGNEVLRRFQATYPGAKLP